MQLMGPCVAGAAAAAGTCGAQSGTTVTPVIALYSPEGCSSCPPADRWFCGFARAGATGAPAAVQAFQVAYWDCIGWVDRFADPAYTQRQRQIARWNGQRAIYTPQAVLNGRDWRGWRDSGHRLPEAPEPARAGISLRQRDAGQFEATVSTATGIAWTAYWTVTENAHSSRVRAGENSGELLQHDFAVRQYTPAGSYRSAAC